MNHVALANEVRHENPSGAVIFGTVTDRGTAFWAAQAKKAFHLFSTKGGFAPCGREQHSVCKFLPCIEGYPERACRICLGHAHSMGIILNRDEKVLRSYPGKEFEEFVF